MTPDMDGFNARNEKNKMSNQTEYLQQKDTTIILIDLIRQLKIHLSEGAHAAVYSRADVMEKILVYGVKHVSD